MPRILPQRASNQPLRVVGQPRSRPPLQSPASAAAPSQALARVGYTIAAIGQDAAEKLAELRRGRQLIEASNGAEREAAAFYDRQLADPDHEGLPERIQAGFDKIRDKWGKITRDPRAKLAFQQSFEGYTTQQLVKARDVERKQEIDRSRTMVDAELDALKARAIDASGPELDQTLGMAQGVLAWSASVGLTTQEAAGEAYRQFAAQVSNARVTQDIRVNPYRALAELNAGAYPDLDEERRQNFINQAENAAETMDRQVAAAKDKAEADQEKVFKEQRESVITAAVGAARDGNLTLTALEELNRRWRLPRTDYSVIRDYIEGGPTHASDPDALQSMTLAVNSTTPSTSQSQLAAAYDDGTLNRKDYLDLSSRLRTNQQHNESEAKSETRYRHSQAEQQVRAAFGSTSPLDQLLDVVKQPLALAMEELTRRSSAFDGSEDPLVVANDVVKKYLPVAGGAAQARLKAMLALAPYKTMDALGTLDEAQARGMSRQEWERAAQTLQDINDLRDTVNLLTPEVPPEDLGR